MSKIFICGESEKDTQIDDKIAGTKAKPLITMDS
jgi:hypothetical protein